MKTKLVAILAVIGIGWAMPLEAYDPVQVQQLLKTKQCAGCDLTNANLG
jgi:hypothetical protein